MADQRNLSIPINLAFLAGLLAASHLATAMAPRNLGDALEDVDGVLGKLYGIVL